MPSIQFRRARRWRKPVKATDRIAAFLIRQSSTRRKHHAHPSNAVGITFGAVAGCASVVGVLCGAALFDPTTTKRQNRTSGAGQDAAQADAARRSGLVDLSVVGAPRGTGANLVSAPICRIWGRNPSSRCKARA